MTINLLRNGIILLILVGFSHVSLALSGSNDANISKSSVEEAEKVIVVTSVLQENIFRQVVARPNNGYAGGGAIGAVLSYSINSIGNDIRRGRGEQLGMSPYQDILSEYNVSNAIHHSVLKELSENGYEIIESHEGSMGSDSIES